MDDDNLAGECHANSHFSSCLEVKFGLLPFLKTVLYPTIYKFVFKL